MKSKGRWILNSAIVLGVTAGWIGWRALPPPVIPASVPCVRGINRYDDVHGMRIEVDSKDQAQNIEDWFEKQGVAGENVHESPDGNWLAFYRKQESPESTWSLYVLEKKTGKTISVGKVFSSDDNPGLPIWRQNSVYKGLRNVDGIKLVYYSVNSDSECVEELSLLPNAGKALGNAFAILAAGWLISRLGKRSDMVRSFFKYEGGGYVSFAASVVGEETALRTVEALADISIRDPVHLLPFAVLPLVVNYTTLAASDLYRLFQPHFWKNLGRFAIGLVDSKRRSETQYALFYGEEWKSMDAFLVEHNVNAALLCLPGVLGRLERDSDEVGFIGRFAPSLGRSIHAAALRNLPKYGQALFEAFDYLIKSDTAGVIKNLDDFAQYVPAESRPDARIAAGYVMDKLSRRLKLSDKDKIVCERKALDWYEAGVRALIASERFATLSFHSAFRKEVGHGLRNEYLQATIIPKRVPEREAGPLMMEHHLLSEYHKRLPALIPRPLVFLPRKDGKAYLFELRMGFETLYDVFATKTKSEQSALLEEGVRQLALVHRASPWILLENASKENEHFYSDWLMKRTKPITALYSETQACLERMIRGFGEIDKTMRSLPLAYYKDACHWNSVMNPHAMAGGPPFFPVDFELRQESGIMPVVIDLATFLCFDGVSSDLKAERELCEIYRQEIPSCGKVPPDLFWQGFCVGAAYRLPAMAGYRFLDFGRTGDAQKRAAGISHIQNALEHAKTLPRALMSTEYIKGLEGVLRSCDT